MRILNEQTLRNFCVQVFRHMGHSPDASAKAADVLIAADLRGIDSHGIARLSGYYRLYKKGRINPHPEYRIIRENATTATLDADASLGLTAAPFAMNLAIQKAKEFGSGWVAVQNSNHFGIAAYHSLMAVDEGMIGICMTNASPLVTPAFGAERMLGTNPVCVAIPAGKNPPFVMDMATSAVSNGKLEIAERKGADVPQGWVVDKHGQPSTDAKALKSGGMLLPLGSDAEHSQHKGYAMGAWVDIMSAVLPGAGFGPWAPPFVSFLDPKPDMPGKGLGHFFGAWRVDGFREQQEFLGHMDLWIERFRKTRPANPEIPVQIPGEPEYREYHKRLNEGIPVVDAVWNDLNDLASETGIEPLQA